MPPPMAPEPAAAFGGITVVGEHLLSGVMFELCGNGYYAITFSGSTAINRHCSESIPIEGTRPRWRWDVADGTPRGGPE
jgi:hypothetical protein